MRQIALRFNPPRGPSPNRRSGGFGRGDSCPVEIDADRQLTALAIPPSADQAAKELPETSRQSVGGETTAAAPTFWFYVPYTRSQSEGFAQFMLLDEAKQPVFNKPMKLMLTDQAGVVSVNLPARKTLDVNKFYYWYFSVICNLERPSRNPSVNGWIKRIDPDPDKDAQSPVWYDALNAVASDYRQSPKRLDFQPRWKQFLSNNGFKQLNQEQLAQCCTPAQELDDGIVQRPSQDSTRNN